MKIVKNFCVLVISFLALTGGKEMKIAISLTAAIFRQTGQGRHKKINFGYNTTKRRRLSPMKQNENQRKSYDFFQTLPTELQNQLALQRKLTAENKAPQAPPIPDKYHFTSWFD